MAIVAGLDFETTGLDSLKDRVIEIACVVWDWDSAVPLQMQSDLVQSVTAIPKEITELTGITVDMLDLYGESELCAFMKLDSLIYKADYVMAHFGNNFDRKFYAESVSRLNVQLRDKLWLDSSVDIVFPKSITTRNLKHLAVEHGFCPTWSHRSLFDVLSMLKIASEYRLEDIVKRAAEPTLIVQALVSFEEKEKAKERGYRWYAPTKTWWRSFKSSDFMAEKDICGFRTQLLDKAPE